MATTTELLTIAETAELMKISPATLNAWRLRGTGPPWLKLAAAVRYDRTSLSAWLKEQEHTS